MLFQEAVEKFLANIELVRNYSCATVRSYRSDLYLFIRYLSTLGISLLEDVNREVVMRFLADQQVLSPKKPATIRRRGHAIGSLFKFCLSCGHVALNIMNGIELPKKIRNIPRILTEVEIEKYLFTPIIYRKFKWLIKRDEAVLKTLLLLGIRLAELLGIKVTDIDFVNQTIIITGKGGKVRILPLPLVLLRLWKEYLDMRPRVKTDKLFLAANGRRALGRNGLYSLFYKHLRRCGIDRKGITPHKMRHTCAVRVYRKSHNLLAVQRLLGHASLSSSEIYLQISDPDLRAAVEGAF
ncbi:tyrosine-type recombinase/integrase [Candidatus Margulisiibacteriota bacterium]